VGSPSKVNDGLYLYRTRVIKLVEVPCSTGWSREYTVRVKGIKHPFGTLSQVAEFIDGLEKKAEMTPT